MKIYRNEEKDEILRNTRWKWFLDVENAIDKKQVLAIVGNSVKYPSQMVMIVKLWDYAWRVPFIDTEHGRFLITMYPSRKETKIYISNTKE